MSNPPLGTAPASAHGIINIIFGVLWILGVPVIADLAISFPIWVLGVVVPLWMLATARVTDKFIPSLTGPVIDRIYRYHDRETASYPLPFKRHAIYRVEEDILGDFDKLGAGTTLRYTHSGYSIYDEYIGFFFVDFDGHDRRWDIRDDEDPIAESKGKFTELAKVDLPQKQKRTW